MYSLGYGVRVQYTLDVKHVHIRCKVRILILENTDIIYVQVNIRKCNVMVLLCGNVTWRIYLGSVCRNLLIVAGGTALW